MELLPDGPKEETHVHGGKPEHLVSDALKKICTPLSYPVGKDGKFESSVAEFVHVEAEKFGLNRDQTRHLIQAFRHAEEKSCKAYEDHYHRCVRCFQDIKHG